MARAAKSQTKDDIRQLSGPERSAVLMLALGEEYGTQLWKMLDEDEIKEISQLSATGSLMGSYESTERLLTRFMPEDKVGQVMEEIRGPAGRTMWDKLGNVNESVLANYLKNEYPQTVSVVLSKIKPEHAARVLAALPEEFAME